MNRQHLLANMSVLLAVVFFGAATVATRVAVQEVAPLALAVLRYGVGALILFAFVALGAPRFLRVRPRDVPFLLLLGGILYAWFPLTFNAGLELTEASQGALMLATLPLWSAVLGASFGGERLNSRQVAGVLLTVAGLGIAVGVGDVDWRSSPREFAGDALMLVTAFAGALYGVLSRRALSRYSPVTVTTYGMVLGTLLLLPPALGLSDFVQTFRVLEGQLLILVGFLATFAGALGWFLYSVGLTHLTPTQVAVYVNLNPIVATLLAVWLLDERITVPFAAGLLTVIAGVLCVNWPATKEGESEHDNAASGFALRGKRTRR